MRAGELDRRITFRRAKVTGKDARNNPILEWSDLATVWAKKSDVRDGERFLAAQAGSSIVARFQVRWSPVLAGLTDRDRIVYGSTVYDIVGKPKEIGRREGLEVSASSFIDPATV